MAAAVTDRTTTTERLASSVFLQVYGRLSMAALPLVVALVGWLATSWLDGKFQGLAEGQAQTNAQVSTLSLRMADISARMAANDTQFALLKQQVDPGLVSAVDELGRRVEGILLRLERIDPTGGSR